MCETLQTKLAADVGLIVQGVAAFELAFDDLLGLFNARFDVSNIPGLKSYPKKLTDKGKVIEVFAQTVNADYDLLAINETFEAVNEFRNRLVHGKITSLNARGAGYEIVVTKLGELKKLNRLKKFPRDDKSYTSNDFSNVANQLHLLRTVVRDLQNRVFRSGSGWPSYLVLPEGDPLNTNNLAEVMKKYA